jgi:S-adenosylmethionine:tRNA ribosyltransferase-isomerase
MRSPVSPEEFDYALPPELVAQRPAARRGDARMLVLGDALEHRRVADLGSVLSGEGPAPLLVRNDSRVVPARLRARRGDGRDFELLVCEPSPAPGGDTTVRAWVRGGRRLRPGDELVVGGALLVHVGGGGEDGRGHDFRVLRGRIWDELLARGELPLPPYIARPQGPTPEDCERYQTVFARHDGSVAAPTAGLHFEPGATGVETVDITLHVGPGTFLPMDVADVADHRVGSERFEISAAAAAAIEAARAAGRPIVAVGTTTVRALETAAAADGRVRAGKARTELVIRPGHAFRVVDRLLTNFHLPRSSLLMLVCAFAGRERVLAAYAAAVAAGYRFHSYGDCMLAVQHGMQAAR